MLILPNASGPIGEVAIQRGPRHGAFALTALAVPIMVLGATMHLYLPKVGLRVAVSLGLFLLGAGLFSTRFLAVGSTYRVR